MTWAAVVVVGASAVSAGVAANSANKRAKAAGAGMNEAIAYARQNPGVFGMKPEWEEVSYSPLFKEDPGYGNIAGDTIAGNQRNLGANLQLAGDTNKWITQDSIARIDTLYPKFSSAFDQQANNTQNFLRGDIPTEDRNAITARRTEAQSLGGGGAGGGQVAADLGLARMDLMGRGGAMLADNVNLFGAIDPVNRRMSPQSMFVDPQQAISMAVNENQFGATFEAAQRDAELNYNMLPDPQKAGMLNLFAARGGAQAANPQQSVFGAAAMGAVNAGVGYYQAQQTPAWAKNMQQTPQATSGAYIQRPAGGPTYATAADQAAGYNAFSGAGPVANTNPAYTQQGSLNSYFSGSSKTAPRTAW